MITEYLNNPFDSVIMLTSSNWHTQKKNNCYNCYHDASRFANIHPVLFVQPDLAENEYRFEDTELHNVTILHIWNNPDKQRNALLQQALLERHIINPLFWVYNETFTSFLENFSHSFIVYSMENHFLKDLQYQDERMIVLNANEVTNQDYDITLMGVYTKIIELFHKKSSSNDKQQADILILGHHSLIESTPKKGARLGYESKYAVMHENLRNFAINSKHRVFFRAVNDSNISEKSFLLKLLNFTHKVNIPVSASKKFDFSNFEAIIFHHSCETLFLSESIIDEFKKYNGYKILLLQEEYINIDDFRLTIETLGIHLVITALQKPGINVIYSKTRFPFVEFKSIWDFMSNQYPVSMPITEDMLLNFVHSQGFFSYPMSFYREIDQHIQARVLKYKKVNVFDKLIAYLIRTDLEVFTKKLFYILKSFSQKMKSNSFEERKNRC